MPEAHPSPFQIRVCPRCGLRFTAQRDDPRAGRCPMCRAETVAGAEFGRAEVTRAPAPARGPQVEVLLDNIRSAWNVGSMLRSADGAGVRRVHLCGVSATPDQPKVAKTALGAEKSVAWQYHADGVACVRAAQAGGLRAWALEGGPRAEDLLDLPAAALSGAPILLVVGNELTGVDTGILDLCERVVSLPMRGVKGSLNVAVAFGVAVYALRRG